MCDHAPKFRRDCCRACYLKLGAAGLPIGPDGRGRANSDRGLRQLAARLSSATPERLDALMARVKPDARAAIEAALAKGRAK